MPTSRPSNPESLSPSASEPLLIDARRAANTLGISTRKLWQMTAEFEIPCTRIGTRNLYSPDALRAWIAKKSRGGEE